MDIENIAKWIGIISGVVTILFGKSIYDLLKEWRQERRRKKEELQKKSSESSLQKINAPVITGTVKEVEEHNREKIVPFSDLVKSGKYQKALDNVMPERNKLESELSKEDSGTILLLHDFDVWFARALIYTGKTNEGLEKLNTIIDDLEKNTSFASTDKLMNEILARAHNDRGYAYWMDKGHYKLSIEEFNAAIRGFLLSCTNENEKDRLRKGPLDELATAYDNLGRVYVQIGDRLRSEILIEYGREIREDICDRTDSLSKSRAEYRYALSLNSMSILHLAFGEPYKAQKLSELALRQFRVLPGGTNSRGTGLALLTKGQSLREIGKMWRNNHPSRKSYFERIINLSIITLEQAEKFFTENKDDSDRIWEPIRICQIKNEIGCAYRELAELTNELRIAKRNGVRYLSQSIGLAENKFPLLFLDGCEDLARLYMLVGDEKSAKEELERAEEKIKKEYSPMYHFSEIIDLKKVEPKECIEEFWQYLGKIYALRGHVSIAHSKSLSIMDNNMKEAIEYYVFAMGYFGLFAEKGRKYNKLKIRNPDSLFNTLTLVSYQAFLKELHHRLKVKDSSVIEQTTIMGKEITKKYHLRSTWVRELYNIADLIMQTKPSNTNELMM